MKRILSLTLALSLLLPALSQDSQNSQAPSAQDSVLTHLRAMSGTTYFLALLNMAGLSDTLEADGPFTVFVPADDAFLYIPDDEFEALMADPDELLETLSYHIVEGAYSSDDLLALESLVTLSGDTINLEVSDTGPLINEANVIAADIQAGNGIIHVINAVLRPAAGDITPPA